MPLFSKKPKWIGNSKTIIGVVFMAAAAFLGPMGFDVSFVKDFLSGTLDEGVFTIGAVLAVIGRYLADSKVSLWPPGDNG